MIEGAKIKPKSFCLVKKREKNTKGNRKLFDCLGSVEITGLEPATASDGLRVLFAACISAPCYYYSFRFIMVFAPIMRRFSIASCHAQ